MRPGQKLPSDASELNGATKAAILLLTLDHEGASSILRELSSEMVEEVTRVLASLGEVPPGLTEQVVSEFYALRLAAQNAAEGGLDYAKMLLQESLDPKLPRRQWTSRVKAIFAENPVTSDHPRFSPFSEASSTKMPIYRNVTITVTNDQNLEEC